jgi:hypothetical protein
MPNLVNAWKDAHEDLIFLSELDARMHCNEIIDGYVIQESDDTFIYEFYEDYFDAERAMCEMYGGVSIGPDYIAIYDDQGEEIAYWIEDEWLNEPELAINLANAIRIYYTKGPKFMKELLGK